MKKKRNSKVEANLDEMKESRTASKDSSNYKRNSGKKPVKYSISKFKGEDYGNSKSGSSKSEWYSSTGKPTNDPNWYTQLPILSADIANLWFSRPTGEYFPTERDVTIPSSRDFRKYNPGIMVFETMSSWGGTETNSLSSSAINVAAAKLYQFVVHANSRNTTYDEKDLLMVIMQVDAILQVITEAKRAYQLIAQSDFTNLFVRRLLLACGWDAEELQSNPLKLKEIIDIATDRINREFIPGIFSILQCHASMYANVYLDDLSAKSQLYLTKSAGVWIYNDEHGDLSYQTIINTGDRVVTWSAGDNVVYHSLGDLSAVLNYMLDTLKGSRYSGLMEGDLLKAFGIETMVHVPYVEENSKITPVFDTEFLFKLHNSELRGKLDNNRSLFHISNYDGDEESQALCIYRDSDIVDGNIIDLHKFSSDEAENQMVNTYFDIPANVAKSPENILLMACYKVPTSSEVEVSGWRLDPEATTTITAYRGGLLPENILRVRIMVDPDNPDNLVDISNVFLPKEYTNSAQLGNFVIYSSLALNFNVTPRIPQHTYNPEQPGPHDPYAFGFPAIWDSTDVLIVPRTKINRMQYVILNSLWSARVIGNTGD